MDISQGYITPPGITIQPNYESHNLCPVCSAGLCGAQQSGYNTPMGYISTPSNPQITNNIIVYNQNYYN